MLRPNHPWRAIALFFAAAYALSWSAWAILFGRHLSHIRGTGFYIYVLAILMPHASAVLVSALEGGMSGVRNFYRTAFRRPSVRWVVIAVVAPVAIYLTRYVLASAFGQTDGAAVFHPAPRTLFVLLFGQSVVAIGEEPGWRGFAQGRLTRWLGEIPGSVLLGVGWAVWHLPLFLIEGTAQYGTSFFAFLVTLVAWSLIVTYLVRQARAAAIVAMVFHASANICDFTVWEPHSSVLAVMPWLIGAAFATWQLSRDSTRQGDAGA